MVFNSSSLSFTQSQSHSTHSHSTTANNKENSTTSTRHSHQSSNGKMPTPTTTTTPFSPHHQQTPPNPSSSAPTTTTTTGYVSHYTRPVRNAPQSTTAEPTMTQLLANQPTSIAHYSRRNQGDGDSTMGNATGLLSWRKGQGFKEWEKVKLNSMEVKRKADVAQLCKSRLPIWSLRMLQWLTNEGSTQLQSSMIIISTS